MQSGDGPLCPWGLPGTDLRQAASGEGWSEMPAHLHSRQDVSAPPDMLPWIGGGLRSPKRGVAAMLFPQNRRFEAPVFTHTQT